MPRILIISADWPLAGEPGPDFRAQLAESLSGVGFGLDVVTSSRSADSTQDATEDAAGPVSVMRFRPEPVRRSGVLFGLRNALFFDTAANPGNYALLRDRLHMHLQDVLYDAVIILCPPQIYLRLGYWIDATFGIPVWVHLQEALSDAGRSGFTRWNHSRLRRRYLGAAKLITAASAGLLPVPLRDEQSGFIALPEHRLLFKAPESEAACDAGALLGRMLRKKSLHGN